MNRHERRAEARKRCTTGPPSALIAAAMRHHQAGRLAEAASAYRDILSRHPAHADSLHLLGLIAQAQGDLPAAIAHITQAIALVPTVGPYHFNIGRAFEEAGLGQEAIASYRAAIRLWPANPDAHVNLAGLLQAENQPEDAIASFRQAIAHEPGFAEAHTGLAAALHAIGALEEALAHADRAIALAPHIAAAHLNLGVVLQGLGRRPEAVAAFRQALVLQPDFAVAHHNLGLALLAAGDWPAGWAHYEWRWQTPRLRGARRDDEQPLWQGEPAPGQTLLIHAEQGFGDTIQFARYAPLVAARGLRVILEVQPPLKRLLSQLPAVHAIARGDPLPPFDLHVPLMSLPGLFATTPETIPPGPILHPSAAEAARVRHLATIAGDNLRVGLAWAGAPGLAADRQRSIPPHQLARLADIQGVTLFSLQKHGPPAPFAITRLIDEPDDFAATAAIIANLDLVIAVDTAVAHLAGAMARPVWLLNRYDSCWRWLIPGAATAWYPTLTLYRQPRPSDWAPVIASVADDLRRRAAAPR